MQNTLLSRLRDFGLNPQQWQVKLSYQQANKPLKATLIHKSSKDFSLKGDCHVKLDRGNAVLEWKSLSWAY